LAQVKSKPIPIKVRSHSGYKAEEYPKAFTISRRTFKIENILDRWYGVDHAYFKVIADDSNLYILRYDKNVDAWEVVFMEATSYWPEHGSS
jgi:hypothetical protein